MGKLTISMAIFNSYVKLPEGRSNPFQLAFVLRYLMAGAGGSFVEDKKTAPESIRSMGCCSSIGGTPGTVIADDITIWGSSPKKNQLVSQGE